MITEAKTIRIFDGKKYYVETISTTIDGKPFTIENWIPVFKSEAEREKVKEQIANDLYKVFAKYT